MAIFKFDKIKNYKTKSLIFNFNKAFVFTKYYNYYYNYKKKKYRIY